MKGELIVHRGHGTISILVNKNIIITPGDRNLGVSIIPANLIKIGFKRTGINVELPWPELEELISSHIKIQSDLNTWEKKVHTIITEAKSKTKKLVSKNAVNEAKEGVK